MVGAVPTGRSTVLGFDFAWFSFYLPSALYLLSSCCYMYLIVFVTFFTLALGELRLVGLALDLVD